MREPIPHPVDLACLGVSVLQQRQQHIDSVEHDPGRADLLLLRLENRKHAGELEVARMHHGWREAGVQEEQLGSGETGQAPAE